MEYVLYYLFGGFIVWIAAVISEFGGEWKTFKRAKLSRIALHLVLIVTFWPWLGPFLVYDRWK